MYIYVYMLHGSCFFVPLPRQEANPNGYRVEVLDSVLDLNSTVYVNSTLEQVA